MIRRIAGVVAVLVAIGWFIRPGNATLAGRFIHQAGVAVGQLLTALLS